MLAELAAAAPAPAEPTPEVEPFAAPIDIDAFGQVDLRVAEVVDCAPIKRAKKLLQLTLNDGSGTPRTVCSGIAKWYTPDQLIGHRVVVIANLKPAVLCGVESAGMILAADVPGENGETAARVLFADELPIGSKLR